MSIKAKMATIILITLTVFMTANTFLSIQMYKKEIRTIFQDETAEKVKMLNLYLENYLATPISLVENTASDVGNVSTDEQKNLLRNNLETKVGSVEGVIALHVAFKGEKGLYSSDHVALDADYNSNERDWFKEAMNNPGEVIVTDPYIDSITNKLIVGVSKTLDNGNGVVTLDLDLAFLEGLVSSINIGDEGYAFVIDRYGKILYHPTYKQGEDVTTLPFYEDFTKNDYIQTVQNDETVHINRFYNEQMNWQIGSIYPNSEIEKKYKGIVWNNTGLNTISIIIMSVIFFFIISTFIKPLNNVIKVATNVAGGKLTEKVVVKTEDEIGKLGASFNDMTDGLKTMIHQVDETAGKLNEFSLDVSASIEENLQSITQVVDNIQNVSNETKEQIDAAQHVQHSIQQMDIQISQITETMHDVTTATKTAEKHTNEGVNVMGNALNQMKSIDTNAKLTADNFNTLISVANEIDEFSKVISGIAAQTNLLALNASIEAARAGEHGKGFAVVAEEVRKLAEQTNESANEIQMLVGSIHQTGSLATKSISDNNEAVTAGINQIASANEVFNTIHTVMGELTTKVEQAQNAIVTLQQRKVEAVQSADTIVSTTQRVSDNVEQVAATTEEQNASMEQMAHAAEQLASQAKELQQSIRRFEV